MDSLSAWLVSVFMPCISSHHIGNAYRRTISVAHIVASTNQPPPPERTNERNGNELTLPVAGPEMPLESTIIPDRTEHAPIHLDDPQSNTRRSPDEVGRWAKQPRHPDPVPEPSTSIDQIPPVSVSPYCQFTTGPPRPDLVPNRPEARPNQDRRF